MAATKSHIVQNRTQRKSVRTHAVSYAAQTKPPRSHRIMHQRVETHHTKNISSYQTLPRVPIIGGTFKHALAKAKSTKKTRAIVRGGFIAYTLAWFYPVQLLFALFFLLAWGAASMSGIKGWLVSDVAETVMMLSWIVLIALGVGFMMYAAILFFTSRVAVWQYASASFMFAVCLAGYFAPLLFFFPWVFLWIATVIWAQK